MRKLILLAGLTFGIFSQQAMADAITLKCSLTSSRYPNLEDIFKTQSITLTGQKQFPEGAKKLFTIDELSLEFWAMNHGIITQNGDKWVMNYQVAAKNTENGQFLHALSNDRIGTLKSRARISLVAYHDNSMLEAGELMFDCESE